MPRPHNRRRVCHIPPCACFKPAGIPARELEDVIVTVDEYEAIRLADLDGFYQEQVAEKMGVSRQTIGRILQNARRKVAEALVNGKALRIEGGSYVTDAQRQFLCSGCGHGWSLPFGGGPPGGCPSCGGTGFHRIDAQRGGGRGRRRGNGSGAR